MPSPIAHGAAAYAVYLACKPDSAPLPPWTQRNSVRLFMTLVVLCLLPDFGSILGVVTGDFGRFHNSWEHSLLVGLAVATLAGAAVVLARGWQFWHTFLIVLSCYESHVLMDWATIGRGVKLFWPLSGERWHAPFNLFYGLHWSDGWWTVRHLWTAITEIAFALVLAAALIWWKKRTTSSVLQGQNLEECD